MTSSDKNTLPSSQLEPERYEGRPLILILDNYILDCIGELASEKQALITSIVQKVFGGGSDWKKTVREVLQLSESIEDNIRSLWIQNQEIAAQNNSELHPVQFAKMIVDDNFAEFIDKQT
ncbi:hypothetical protein L0244_09620 [bacterium]|nr:hypothetical protein [bacterium]MCI0613237.1 hypothetical protein [bacterium]